MEGQISYEQQLKDAHQARKARIAARAVPDKPINCASASVRAGGLVDRVRPLNPAEKPKVELPADYMDAWIKRQLKNFKPPWFSIVDDVPIRVGVVDIQRAVARHYRLSMLNFLSDRRTPDLTVPRFVAFYLCRELTSVSFPKIGRLFGGRDHSTVINGVDRITRLRQQDPELSATIDYLKEQIINETHANLRSAQAHQVALARSQNSSSARTDRVGTEEVDSAQRTRSRAQGSGQRSAQA